MFYKNSWKFVRKNKRINISNFVKIPKDKNNYSQAITSITTIRPT